MDRLKLGQDGSFLLDGQVYRWKPFLLGNTTFSYDPGNLD